MTSLDYLYLEKKYIKYGLKFFYSKHTFNSETISYINLTKIAFKNVHLSYSDHN
jgi:hypothetical protein